MKLHAKENSQKSGSEVRMENSIDAQQCEGGGRGVDRELMVMSLRRTSSCRWSETIDQSIFLIWGMRRLGKAKTDGIWEANTKEETQEERGVGGDTRGEKNSSANM